jgi:hypothetical protein
LYGEEGSMWFLLSFLELVDEEGDSVRFVASTALFKVGECFKVPE